MVTGGNVTGIVDLLEREGQVERAAEPTDRRAYRVRLTRAGRKAFGEMARAHEEWILELLVGMSRKEQAEVFRLLGRLKEVTMEAKS
jgi:DNA-binding MarR family transcriptional regulator